MSAPSNSQPDPGSPRGYSRWSMVGWLLAVVALGALVAGLLVAVQSRESAVNLAGLVADGARPEAPALPKLGLDGDALRGVADSDVVVVNFWASWCGPCREETPALDEVARSLEDDGVTIVGVNAGAEDTLRDARAFAREFDVSYPIARGTKAEVDRWGVRGYPETYVIGRDGKVAAHVDGPVDGQTVRALVERELARSASEA